LSSTFEVLSTSLSLKSCIVWLWTFGGIIFAFFHIFLCFLLEYRFAHLRSSQWSEVLITWNLSVVLFSVLWWDLVVADLMYWCTISHLCPWSTVQEQQI
jgi:hypothetical protein